MTMTTEITLSPAEQKRQGIIDAATALFRDLLGTHIDQACIDANEALQDDENAVDPEAKMGFTVAFNPLAQSPEVTVKIAWSAKRSDEATATVNDPQLGIAFPVPAEPTGTAETETPGAWKRRMMQKGGGK